MSRPSSCHENSCYGGGPDASRAGRVESNARRREGRGGREKIDKTLPRRSQEATIRTGDNLECDACRYVVAVPR